MTVNKSTGLLAIKPMNWDALKSNDFYSDRANIKDIALAYRMDAVPQQGDKHLMYLSMGIRKAFKNKSPVSLRKVISAYRSWSEKRYESMLPFKPEACLYPFLKIIMGAAVIDNDVKEVYENKIKNVYPHLDFVQKEYFNKNNHEVNAGMMNENHEEFLRTILNDSNLSLRYVEYTDPSGIIYSAVHSEDFKTVDMLVHYAEELEEDPENFLLSLATDADYSRDWAELIRRHGVLPPGQTYTKLVEYFNKKHFERKTNNR